MRILSLCLWVSTSSLPVWATAPSTDTVAGMENGRALYVCTARSILGKRFSATGFDKVLTQEEAMQRCEAHAFRCYRTGCDVTSER
jgi:hypothetical protein